MWYKCVICLDLGDSKADVEDETKGFGTRTTLDKMSSLDCGHSFHNSCITTWLGDNSSCPVCRITTLYHLTTSTEKFQSAREVKLKNQLEILKCVVPISLNKMTLLENLSLSNELEKEKHKSDSWARRNNECLDQLDEFKSEIATMTTLKRENEKYKAENEALKKEIFDRELCFKNFTKQFYIQIDKMKASFTDETEGNSDSARHKSTLASPETEEKPSTSINLERINTSTSTIPQPQAFDFSSSSSKMEIIDTTTLFARAGAFGRTEFNFSPDPIQISHTCNCKASLCSHGNCGCTRKNIPCNRTCYCQIVNGGLVCHNPWTK